MELDNLAEDVGERDDLANINPTERDELLDDLLAWIKATGASMASEPNPKYNPAAKVRRKQDRGA
ncbi:MAG: hypothetical protein NZ700_08480 [Gemmataceae bacterium]|nr:hypothetical protein [Gemmataceae bacterium]MDW8266567.1 hypothetical protein [Gemmataceae bacterium]